MSEVEVAVSAPEGAGFSVESLISEANKAWDEPDSSPPDPDAATSQAASSESGAESTSDAQPDPLTGTDRGDGRDEQGRFVAKAVPIEETQDQVAEAPVPKGPTQEPKAEATPETPPGTQEPQQEGAAEPFSFRVAGQDYQIPGAVRTDTHVVIPKEQEETLSKYLGMGRKYEVERDAVKQDKTRLSVEREMFAAETGPVMEEIKRLFEIASLPDESRFAEAFSQYAWELRSQMPLLRERMELSKRRQELEIRERLNAPDPEIQAEQLFHGAVETANSHLNAWKSAPQAKVLTDEDWSWVQGRVSTDPAYFLQRAGQRLTDEESRFGVQPGEVYFNQDRLLDLVNIRLEHRTALARALEAQKQAVAIARENAARQATGKVLPPPPSGGADSAPSKDEDKNKKYKSMADLKKDLGVSW